MTREEAIQVLRDWDGYFIGHGSDDVKEALNMAIEELKKEPKTGYWIPISERLPEADEHVLVDDGFDRFVAWWIDYGLFAGWHSFGDSCNLKPILAWMPLPKPYNAESED